MSDFDKLVPLRKETEQLHVEARLAFSNSRKDSEKGNKRGINIDTITAAFEKDNDQNVDLNRILGTDGHQNKQSPRSPDSQADEDVSNFILEKIYAATVQQSKEIKTPVNFQVGSRFEHVGGAAQLQKNKAIIESLDADLRKPPPSKKEEDKSEAKPSATVTDNRSNQIFNIQNKDTFNMLLNQDKYQNPVDLLRAKFDILSGPTNLSQQSAPYAFGQTPLAGTTYVKDSPDHRKRVAKLKQDLREGRKPQAGNSLKNDKHKYSSLKKSIRDKLAKNFKTLKPPQEEQQSEWERQFHKLPPGVEGHQRSKSFNNNPINFIDASKTIQVGEQERGQHLPSPFHQQGLPDILRPGLHGTFQQTFSPQNLYGTVQIQDASAFNTRRKKSPQVRKGFGVANKTLQALVVIDHPMHSPSMYKLTELDQKAQSTLGYVNIEPTLQSVDNLDHHQGLKHDHSWHVNRDKFDRRNRSTLLQDRSPLLQKKINSNIYNGRIDVIQQKQEAKIQQLASLSRIDEGRGKGGESWDQRLPVLARQQQIPPSEHISYQHSGTTMPNSMTKEAFKPMKMRLLNTQSPASTMTGDGLQQKSQFPLNSSADQPSGSMISIKQLGTHQGNFAAGDLAMYLSNQPFVGQTINKNDINNIQSTQIRTALEESYGGGFMNAQGNPAMARIHSEAFQKNKDFTMKDQIVPQSYHEMSFNQQSRRRLEDESASSPLVMAQNQSPQQPLMINQESRTLLQAEQAKQMNQEFSVTKLQAINMSSSKMLEQAAAKMSQDEPSARRINGSLGSNKVTSNIFKFSDVKHVLDKNIKKLEKPDGLQTEMRVDKAKKKKKQQMAAAKVANHTEDKTKGELTKEEGIGKAPQLQFFDSEDKHTTLDSQSVTPSMLVVKPAQSELDPNISLPYRQKQEFLLKISQEGFGYERSQYLDAKMALDAEKSNKPIGSATPHEILINFEEREKKARMDKIRNFVAQDNPLMSFQVDPNSNLYRQEGEEMADVKEIRTRGRGALQKMTFETAKARKDRIVEGFASCAPALRATPTDRLLSKTPMSKFDKKSGANNTGVSHVTDEKVKTHSIIESSRPGQDPRVSRLSFQSRANIKHVAQTQRSSILSSFAPVEPEILEKDEAQPDEDMIVDVHSTGSKLTTERIQREIAGFERKYKIKMTQHEIIAMIDETLAGKEDLLHQAGKDGKSQYSGISRKPKNNKITNEVLQEEQKKQEEAVKAAQGGVVGGKQRVRLDLSKMPSSKKKCTCGVKDFLKELMRRVKGLDDRLQDFRDDLTLKMQGEPSMDILQPCNHDTKQEIKEEEQEQAMKWLEAFVDKLHFCDANRQVVKPAVFRAFVKKIMDDNSLDEEIQELQQYIRDNNLTGKKVKVDYVDFFQHNPYMAMKKKNKKKLAEGQVARIELEASDDSSIDESDSDAQSQFLRSLTKRKQKTLRSEAKEMYGIFSPGIKQMFENQLKAVKDAEKKYVQNKQLVVYHPDPVTGKNSLQAPKESSPEATQNDSKSMNVFFHRQIVINEKLFQNFICKLVEDGGEDSLEVFRTEKANDLTMQQKHDQLRKQLQEATVDAIEHISKAMEQIVENRRQKEMAMSMPRRNSLKNVVREPNPRLVTFQQYLDDDTSKLEQAARSKQRDLEKKKEETGKQQREQIAQLQQQKQAADEKSEPASPVPQPIYIQRKKSTDSSQIEIKLYEKERQRQVFYQLAKFFIEHPADSYHEKDAILVQFYQDCLNGKQKNGQKLDVAMPKPLFLNMVTDQVLSITNQTPSLTVCNAMKNLLKLAEKNKVKEYQIRKLVIDDSSMDDEKLDLILQGLTEQTALQAIVLMNCQIGWTSAQRIMKLLEKDVPVEVNEFRLINVQLKIDNNTQKKLQYDAQEQEALDGYLRGKQNNYKRPLLGTLLKHIKNNVKKQVYIKQLQLSWLSMSTTWEPHYDLDCSRYIAKLVEADRGSQLEELNLSYCQMTLLQLWKISQALAASFENLKHLSLKGLNLLEMASTYNNPNIGWDNQVTADEIVNNLIVFIEQAICLQHLDLSGMGLGRTLIRIAKEGLKKNKSLLAVHLTQNNLALLDIEEFLEVLDIDHSQVLTQIRKSMGAAEQEDTLGQRGQPCDNVKTMTYLAHSQKASPISPRKARKISDHENAGIESYLRNDLERHLRNERKGLSQQLNNGDQRVTQKNLCNRLVLQRKAGFATTLFDDNVQSRMFCQQKHFSLAQLEQHWQVRFREEECYVCNKYQSYRIFYTRSKAREQFTEIEDKQEISALRLHLKFTSPEVGGANDPYKNLPLLIGSILDQDVPSMRLMNVKHQAALLWSIKHVQNIKGKKVEERQKVMLRNCIKAMQIMMKDGIVKPSTSPKEIKDNRIVIEDMMQQFPSWREQLGITHEYDQQIGDLELKKKQVIINYPVFDKNHASDENDIFFLEGFFKPGTHEIIIYDPELDTFFKRDNIFVPPRNIDLKLLKSDQGAALQDQQQTHADDEITKVYGDKMRGPSLQLYQANIFGDLLHDMSKHMSGIAYEYDFDNKLIDLQRYLNNKDLNEQGRDSLLQTVRNSYHQVLKLWKCLQHKMAMERSSAEEEEQTFSKGAQLLYTIIKDSSLAVEVQSLKTQMGKDPLLLALKEVHDTLRTDFTGVKYPNSIQKDDKVALASVSEFQRAAIKQYEQRALIDNFGHMMPQSVEHRPPCQRRMVPLALLRVFSWISQKVSGAGDVTDLYERYISQCNRFFNEAIFAHNLKELRKAYIFYNKPLVTLLKMNKHLIRKTLYEKYFCIQDGVSTMTFTLTPRYTKLNKLQDGSLQLFLKDLLKITKTIVLPQPSVEITLVDGNASQSGSNQKNAAANISYDTLRRLAIESKMSLLQQEMEGPTHGNYLTFEEFTLFLCQVSIYLYDFDAREKYDRYRGNQASPDVDQGGFIFLLSAFPKSGSKKPTHMQMALNLQGLLLEMQKQKMIHDSEVQIQEMDLSVFKDYIDLIDPSSMSASAMGLVGGSTSIAAEGAEQAQQDDQESRINALKNKRARMKEDSSDYSDGYDEP